MKKENTITNHKPFIIFLLFLLLLTSILLSILCGSVSLHLHDILEVLIGNDTSSTAYLLITTVRIPRMCGGVLAGIGLAVSGLYLCYTAVCLFGSIIHYASDLFTGLYG